MPEGENNRKDRTFKPQRS